MSRIDFVRAFKDEVYFNSLSYEEKAQILDANPIGQGELADEDLSVVSGGFTTAVCRCDGPCRCGYGFGTRY